MIRINLLPPEYAGAQAKKEQQILFGGAGFVVVFILLGFWAVKNAQATSMEKKIRESEAELQKFKAIVAQIETIQKNKKALTAKRDVIKNLNRSRLLYPVFFEDLLPIMPSDVWVDRIDLKQSGNQLKVTFKSHALSNFALASWLTNFEQSKHFSGVQMGAISYSKKSEDQPPVLNFNINCMYQHVGPLPLEEFF